MISNGIGAAHVASAAVGLVLGLVVLCAAKGSALHCLFGAAYVGAMVTVNVTALGLYGLTGHFGPFHALALLSLGTVIAGTDAVLRRRGNWLMRHYQMMAYSYLGLCAAATAEAVVRLKPFGALAGDARGVIAIGVGIALIFAAFGWLIIPRLQRAALGVVTQR